MKKRVVVTGLGIVSPLGDGLDINWKRLINGESGIRNITSFDTTNFPCTIAAEVPRGDGEGLFNPDNYVHPKDQRKMDTFIVYGLAAASHAIKDSGLTFDTEEEKEVSGVSVGSGIGGLPMIEKTSHTLAEHGPRRIPPTFIPATLINLLPGHISINYGLKGPNHSVVTACATGSHAIGDAFRMIQYGDAKVMVTGGSEACISPIGIGGFCAIKALATKFNDRPTQASRPWDMERDGFVMGEGAGILVLEELEHALNRKAKIYAEIVGYGLSGDAYHMTAPAENGDGAYRAMKHALKDAAISPDQIDYINAHGTSTPLGDLAEYHAVKRLLGDSQSHVLMSSTKSSTGHLISGAGAVEAIYSILAMKHSIVPPTLNLDNPDPIIDMDLVPHIAREHKINYALSNSFGFGGTNASLVFKKFEN